MEEPHEKSPTAKKKKSEKERRLGSPNALATSTFRTSSAKAVGTPTRAHAKPAAATTDKGPSREPRPPLVVVVFISLILLLLLLLPEGYLVPGVPVRGLAWPLSFARLWFLASCLCLCTLYRRCIYDVYTSTTASSS